MEARHCSSSFTVSLTEAMRHIISMKTSPSALSNEKNGQTVMKQTTCMHLQATATGNVRWLGMPEGN